VNSDLRDDGPTQPGWYATLHRWDVEEGIFPGAHYWNGSVWRSSESDYAGTNASVQYWPIVFETQEEAEAYAYDNDPEL
jgi:hypothetical protein